MKRLIFALERFIGSEGVFDSMKAIKLFPVVRGSEGESKSQLPAFLNTKFSPSNEIEKKSQRRLLLCSFWNLLCRVTGTNAWYFPVPITDSPVTAKESFNRDDGIKRPYWGPCL